MMVAVLLLATVAAPVQCEEKVTKVEKRAFLKLLANLPTRGEFFTKEAVEKAIPRTRVLLALTKKDIEKCDIYPFLALSRGLLDHKQPRKYGVQHFRRIAHPELKLFWASVLFDKNVASEEIVRFLKSALSSKKHADLLSSMLGPQFGNFKKRVREHKTNYKRHK